MLALLASDLSGTAVLKTFIRTMPSVFDFITGFSLQLLNWSFPRLPVRTTGLHHPSAHSIPINQPEIYCTNTIFIVTQPQLNTSSPPAQSIKLLTLINLPFFSFFFTQNLLLDSWGLNTASATKPLKWFLLAACHNSLGFCKWIQILFKLLLALDMKEGKEKEREREASRFYSPLLRIPG